MHGATLFGLALFGLAKVAETLVEPIPFPEIFHNCLKVRTFNISYSDVPAASINNFCIKHYLYKTATSRFYAPVSNETIRYGQSLFNKVLQRGQMHRKKRQAMSVRREIRALSPAERNTLFARINRLKQATLPNGLNRFDSLAELHRYVSLMNSAHDGPNFVGWHRIYLLLLEAELGMPVPYWDSRMDFYMEDPTDSVLWTPDFFGNGYGDVETGPFANWVTPPLNVPLTRNIGSGGILINDDSINGVLSRNFHVEILEPANDILSLEAHHNGPHIWVDGQLSALETAAQDPVFYFHHCFVDYIWALFRRKLRSQGTPPEQDYPPTNINRQGANDQLIPFNMRNIDAWSNFFERLSVYQPPPSCPDCGPYLECIADRCVSRVAVAAVPSSVAGFGPMSSSVMAVRAGALGQQRAQMAFARRGPLPIGRRFDSPFTDSRTRGDPIPNAPSPVSRVIRSAERSSVNKSVIIRKHGNDRLEHSYQNTFVLDGVADVRRWVFIPVRIIYERPPEFKFHSYVVKNGKLVQEGNIVSKIVDGRTVHLQSAATYPNCDVAGSGAAQIYVQSDGINYAGRFKDYAIVDERLAVSSALTYVGVKNPTSGAGEAILSAYDTCGRICKARCLVNGSYRSCDGAVRITTEMPLMFGLSKEEAVKQVWKENQGLSSEPNELQVPVVFICENQTSWPWAFI